MSDIGPASLPGIPGMFPQTPFPLMVLGPDGKPAQRAPERLSDGDSTKSSMLGYFAYLDQVFPLANYHPDALIAHKGWDYLHEMMTMAAVRTPIHLKLQAMLYKTPRVKAAVESKEKEKNPGDYEKAQEAVDLCQHLIDNITNPETDRCMPLRTVLWNIGQAIGFGFSINELVWRYEKEGKYKGKRFLKTVVFRPNRQIGFDLEEETMDVMNVTSTTPRGGRQRKSIPIKKVMLYTYKPVEGLPYGDGDLRSMAKHHFAIDNCLRWWGIAQKRWGQPFIEASLANMNKSGDVFRDLVMVANGAPFVHGDIDDYEVHALSSSTLDSYQTFASFHSMQMMMTVLGNTLTTTQGDGSSSYALGQTHQSSQNFFLGYPRHDVEDVVTKQMFRRCVEYNMGREYLHITPTLFLGHWDDSERKLIAEFYTLLAEMGVFDPREGWVRGEFNIPEMPEGFDPNDDSLPLLPGRERIQVDQNGNPVTTTQNKKTKDKTKTALRFSQAQQDNIILEAARIVTARHSLKIEESEEEEIKEAA